MIEQGNGGEEDIPLRLIPLTLFGTITTHLFGGSVGREGRRCKWGAIANAVGKVFKLSALEREVLLLAELVQVLVLFWHTISGNGFRIRSFGDWKSSCRGTFPKFLQAYLLIL